MTEAKRRILAARAMSDVGAAQCAGVVQLADERHVFTELTRTGGLTVDELAKACNLPVRLASSILTALAASGYVDFDSGTKKYSLGPEQQSLFANENDPLFVGGAFQLVRGLARNDPAEIEAGISRSSRAKFPPLLAQRLGRRFELGQRVVELGCGSGATLIEIARRYPKLIGVGIDQREAAIVRARRAAEQIGLHERLSFIVGNADELPQASCDIVLCLESLHEFENPVDVARAAFQALRPGGVWFAVEPYSDSSDGGNDRRFLASLEALHCLAGSNFAAGALGPLADRAAYERVVTEGGFSAPAVSTEGPIHLIIEATR